MFGQKSCMNPNLGNFYKRLRAGVGCSELQVKITQG